MQLPDSRPSIRSNRMTSLQDPPEPVRREPRKYDYGLGRPGVNRSATFEGPTQLYQGSSPTVSKPMSRFPSENLDMRSQRSQLRPVRRATSGLDMFGDPSDDSTLNGSSSPDRSHEERSQRSASPATSHGSGPSRNASYSTLDGAAPNGKRQAPPPPPSRSKKPPPPPPPPPMKRSALSTANVSYA